MDQIYDNRYYSAGSREPSPRRARTVQLGGSDYAGADCSTQRPTSASHSRAQVNTSTDRPLRSVRPAHSEHAQRSSAQTHEKPSRPSNRLSGSDFMHYANDNAVVKAIYDFTHGPQRGLFVGIVTDKWFSEEGIKDSARGLGMAMPGEKRIEVLGLDDDSDSSSSKKSSNAKNASEVAKEIEEVGKDAPWYIKTLDMLFGFNGVEGQTVASSGE